MRKFFCKLKKNFQLVGLFILFVTVVLIMTMVMVGIFIVIAKHLGWKESESRPMPFLIFGVIVVVVGTLVAGIFSHMPLKPINKIIEFIDRLALGDFEARIELRGPNEIKKLNNSLNHLAEELNSIEVLRTDFVNNFSHEFKTPIVSIRGFAKILQNNELTEEERAEYLDIIIRESERLAELSTNTLNLSKFENHMILTDIESYNITEQLRRALTIFSDQWTHKELSIDFQGDDITIMANAKYLKQVWINLIDNAIKFANPNTTLSINLTSFEDSIRIHISNQGIPIEAEKIPHIFDKFYQADISHTTKGHGLGLTLVHRILTLHQGSITLVRSDESETCFEVTLPKTQSVIK